MLIGLEVLWEEGYDLFLSFDYVEGKVVVGIGDWMCVKMVFN